ncbi:TonB family protein [Mucilaginibacter frigoritolerans]|jgi:TonB family protein|uniref:TonB family protein n=1 Tax=Mucilaginibacter frigoritolerans TaxID=652788 RepID=A0A562TUD3_9SPHI|nr:M56 family metallopeptidase [Mucilaginibacter frigoritolerans]TWI97155.1 TonB family protein [Mucilaginibacter frigoritolerans]
MSWWQYLMLVNIYLVVFYGFYIILLSRETFFQLNRVYLVTALILSFLIPMIQANWVKSLFITQKVKYTIYTNPVMFYQFKPIRDTQITLGQIFVAIYIIGIAFLLIRFISQLVALNKIIDQPQANVAYSFFKKIRLGNNLENNQVVAAHERVHANQWHSVDILLAEAVMIMNWFNPVVYFYRLAVKHIHEFIADKQAIKAGTTKETYALLLLSQTFNTEAHRLVNPFFNQSLLKKRIKMLQKNNSKYVALVKYGLSAPLFVLMLILSSATVNNSKPVRLFNKKAEQVFLIKATTDSSQNEEDMPALVAPAIKNTGEEPLIASQAKGRIPSFSTDTVPARDNKVFTAIEQVPQFPGGVNAFYEFLANNIQYPAESRKLASQGRVIISFVVEKDGSLTNIHTVRGVDSSINAEAVRVIKLSPKWSPGVQNGHLARVAYSVPIAFTLDDTRSKQTEESKLWNADANEKTDTSRKSAEVRVKEIPSNAIYIVDGKETDNISRINANDIQSITILKDKEAIAQYGKKAVGGVVVLITKKSNSPASSKQF